MSSRLRSDITVAALVRRVSAAGGHAAVLAKGESEAGAILLECADRGRTTAILERLLDADLRYRWQRVGPDMSESTAVRDYLARRRARDPDLWIVELDIPDATRFADESDTAG